ANAASTGAIRPRWRRCWPCPSPHSTCALDSPSPSYNASPRPSAIPKPPNVCSRPSANSSSSCGLPASEKNEARGSKGGGNDGGCKPCGFRPHLGNRCAIPTFPPPRRLLDCFLNSNPERSFPQPSAQASFRLILRLEKTVLMSANSVLICPSQAPSAASIVLRTHSETVC